MGDLRAQIESDISFTVEGDYSLPIVLIGPDAGSDADVHGITQELRGQVLYDWRRLNPDTGEFVTVQEPVVTLRLSSLDPVPQPGETWVVKIPKTPSETGTMETYVINSDRPPEGGGSIGFIRLYLQKATQLDDEF